jgi:hypothetical protein
MVATPLFLAFDEASGRETFCRRCADGSFAFGIDDAIMQAGTRALWIGAVIGILLQALLLKIESREKKQTGWRKRRAKMRRNSYPAFTAAALALTVQALAITLTLLIHSQPAHFYLTLADAGYAIALLPSYLAWFILPAFHERPELDPLNLLETEDA